MPRLIRILCKKVQEVASRVAESAGPEADKLASRRRLSLIRNPLQPLVADSSVQAVPRTTGIARPARRETR